MKLVYVTSSLPLGSGEAFIIPEIQELRKQGHAVKVVPLYPRGRALHVAAEEMTDPVTIQPPISLSILIGAGREFLRAPWRALRGLRLLFTFQPRHLLKNLAIYPKGLWLARIVRQWGAEHIHAHWAATTASMAMVASAVSGVPWSLTAHRWDVVENNLLKRKASRACFFRCISEKTREMALKRGVPAEKIVVLHLGVHLPKERVWGGHLGRREKYVVLCPASFIPIKGHRYLIEAMRYLPAHVELWLAGEGELRSEAEKQVKELGLSNRVRFLGVLSHDQLLALYGEVDLVVLPSVDLGDGLHEGIPVSLIEAMSYGIPVISTNTGGIPELLRDGAGLLVPDKDPKALAEAIQTLYKDPVYAEAVGKAGKKRVEEEFSVERITKQLLELWQGCS